MGNIFENRKNRQLRRIGSVYQIQRLQEYHGKYREASEREKNMRYLKYFLNIGAVMQHTDQ